MGNVQTLAPRGHPRHRRGHGSSSRVSLTRLSVRPGHRVRRARLTASRTSAASGRPINEANWDLQAHEARPGAVTQRGVYPYAFARSAGRAGARARRRRDRARLARRGSGRRADSVHAGGGDEEAENAANWIDRDPELKCYLPGIPRATYMPYPFQIVQSSTKIQMIYTFSNAARTIHLDKVAGPPDDTWMGHSVGRWEGDTLVVDVTHFNDKTWFDRAGNFHSDALHVVERFTPISPDALRYEATIEDPNVFTRPWTIAMPIYRRLEPNIQLLDYPLHRLHGRIPVRTSAQAAAGEALGRRDDGGRHHAQGTAGRAAVRVVREVTRRRLKRCRRS